MKEPKNCLILGSGRSGTSMLAGCFYHTGFYMGERLMPPNEQNIKGYFESFEIEAINERIISYNMYDIGVRRFFAPLTSKYKRGQYWLSELPMSLNLRPPPGALQDIGAATVREPFAFKDPRFSYTLPVWRSQLHDMVYVVVFREPGRTVRSILSTCAAEPYLSLLPMDERRAFRVWCLQYRHIIDKHARRGTWVFLHYNQILDGSGINKLSNAIGVELDRDFPDMQLKRSANMDRVPTRAKEIYLRLCRLAEYEPGVG